MTKITKMKSLRGGNDFMNDNMLYIILGIVLVIIIISIGIYILFFRESTIPTYTTSPSTSPSTSPTPTYESIPTTSFTTSPTTSTMYESIPTTSFTSTPTSKPNKIKKTIDKIKSSKIIKNIEANLKEWKNDINNLPAELKENAIDCYSNPEGCIF
jgi:cytoskeletal protein RodZ